MLNIYFGKLEDSIFATSKYFDYDYEEEWLDDPLVREMIRDIDKSEVISSECIQSPVFGQIPPTKLSGGVKTLILILKEPDKVFYASQCGDNCAKWIIEIAKRKDITINLRHIMDFSGTEFSAVIANTGEKITDIERFIDVGHHILVSQEEEEQQ